MLLELQAAWECHDVTRLWQVKCQTENFDPKNIHWQLQKQPIFRERDIPCDFSRISTNTLNFKGCQCKSSESSAIFSAVKCHKLAMSCHVQVCDTMCKAGYTPSVKRLNCLAETLTPATFVCNPDPCPIPFDKNQAQHDATLWRHVMSPVARHVLS